MIMTVAIKTFTMTNQISDDHSSAIQETNYLMSIPGMEVSIIEGIQAKTNACFDTLFERDPD